MRLTPCWLLGLAAGLSLLAAEAAWKTKPAAQWTEDDARQVLTASPWSREITAGIARRMSEDELREAGQMGQPRGIGYDGLDPKGSGPKLPSHIITGAAPSVRSLPGAISLRVRWESAQPIRIAELKAHEDAAACEKGSYCIAVMGIPGGPFHGDQRKTVATLIAYAALMRDGQPNVRPYSAEIVDRPGDSAVVYFFSPSAEIQLKDGRVSFEAHIGRISVSESFRLAEMMFAGRLEI